MVFSGFGIFSIILRGSQAMCQKGPEMQMRDSARMQACIITKHGTIYEARRCGTARIRQRLRRSVGDTIPCGVKFHGSHRGNQCRRGHRAHKYHTVHRSHKRHRVYRTRQRHRKSRATVANKLPATTFGADQLLLCNQYSSSPLPEKEVRRQWEARTQYETWTQKSYTHTPSEKGAPSANSGDSADYAKGVALAPNCTPFQKHSPSWEASSSCTVSPQRRHLHRLVSSPPAHSEQVESHEIRAR